MASGEIVIIVVPFHDKGHIFPAIELCYHLAARNYTVTILLPFGSSHPASPLISTIEYPIPHPPESPSSPAHFPSGPPSLLRDILAQQAKEHPRQCAIVDVMMSHLLDVCREFSIPAVSFFTSSACSTAIDHATWKLTSVSDNSPIIDLPEKVAVMINQLVQPINSKQRGSSPPPPPPRQSGPPPPLGFSHPPPPRGLQESVSIIALLFNTCDELERPFLEYIAKETGRPAWGVGPLLPANFLPVTSAIIHDEDVRPICKSNISEKDVLTWLGTKPDRSVVYISFGSLVAPSDAELTQLAAGLEEAGRPFIWALQPGAVQHDPLGRPTIASSSGHGYYPVELARVAKGEGRGLIINGWAPQLLILSHRSTGGFLTHCGWNSTVEALACGVPLLTWPICGDQMHNAALVTSQLKIGHTVASRDRAVTRDEVVQGIKRIMSDGATRERAASISSIFAQGFPKSSSASLDDFLELLRRKSQ